MQRNGFNLIEITISLTIISLVIAMVLTGRHLKDKAEVQQFLTEMADLSTSVSMFVDKYQGLPGDLWNAESFFETAVNGGGDQLITLGPEQDNFWGHLDQAELFSKTLDNGYSGFIVTTGTAPNVVALGAIHETIYMVLPSSEEDMVEIAVLSERDGITALPEGPFGIKQSFTIDRDFDDRNPASGIIRTNSDNLVVDIPSGVNFEVRVETSDPACLVDPVGSAYNLANEFGTPCWLRFRIY